MGALTDFIERKRLALAKLLAPIVGMVIQPTWGIRLRVRLGNHLDSDESELQTSFRGRSVRVKSRNGRPLHEAEWVVFLASRFRTFEGAAAFGTALQSSLSVAAALRSVPIDVGPDNAATAGAGDVVREVVAKAGSALRDDVHGLDIYPEGVNTTFLGGGATIAARQCPDLLFSWMHEVGRDIERLDKPGRSAALLINASLLADHPVAKLALSVAAVELISATEKWKPEQKAWIRRTKETLAADDTLPDVDRAELMKAVEGLFNFGALEKTRRLIRTVGREDLLEAWNELYRGRSTLFHGSRYLANAEVLKMSAQATALCKSIVEAYIAHKIGHA